jgi:actin cytoskeleton-regulatory complex protein SLA1
MPVIGTAVAKYNLCARYEDEVPLSEGEVVSLIEKREEEWWLVRKESGSEGLAPHNYLNILTIDSGVLPTGWSADIDHESGDPYYFNEVLGNHNIFP